MVDKFTAVIAVKLPERERQDAVNVFKSLKSPDMGLVEEGIQGNPARCDRGRLGVGFTGQTRESGTLAGKVIRLKKKQRRRKVETGRCSLRGADLYGSGRCLL
jgi:hypothetical protein